MRIELALLFLCTGCVSARTASDIDRVHELSRMPIPAEASNDDDVRTDPDPNVHAMLAKPIDVETAVRVALVGNRELRATLRALGVPRGRLVQAALLPNPILQFDVRSSENRSLPLQVDLFAAYDLKKLALTPMAASVARAELESARFRAAAAVLALGREVRVAFFDLLAAEQRLTASTRSLDALAAARDATKALFDSGNVPELDWRSQAAAYESARAAHSMRELERLDAREHLQTLLGLHGEDTSWTTATSLAEPPSAIDVPADLEQRAVTANLDLAARKQGLEALARKTGLTRLEGLIPDLTGDVHGKQNLNAWEIGGGATFTVPMFDRKQGELAADEAEFDAELERWIGAAIGVRSSARVARNHVRTNWERAMHHRNVVLPALRSALEQSVLQYNAMRLNVLQVLQARREELEGELAYAEALRDYWRARAELDALLAGAGGR